MSKRSNTHPYTNANRAGRTQPGLIELMRPDDPRLQGPNYAPNRATFRAKGVRGSASRRLPGLQARTTKVARRRCQHGTVLPYPWSLRVDYCSTCRAEVEALTTRNEGNPINRTMRRVLSRLGVTK